MERTEQSTNSKACNERRASVGIRNNESRVRREIKSRRCSADITYGVGYRRFFVTHRYGQIVPIWSSDTEYTFLAAPETSLHCLCCNKMYHSARREARYHCSS